ncbi:hypothetical protein [Streptomyces shenzhenensis]|uniref:hypothetical protein n=1 Tax=Streptomyces shenzhenensis TaxID=943815 RepID=UPI0033FAC3C0
MTWPHAKELAAAGDGTAADLVADAQALGFPHVTRRLITEWTHRGLLASPRFRQSSRGGSDPRLYSGDQRRLFCVLLYAAQSVGGGRTPGQKHLALAVIGLWARGMPSIPTEQVRRALTTVTDSLIHLPAYQARGIAQLMVDATAHPSAPAKTRRGAVLILTDCLHKGSWDTEAMHSALTSVTSPWPAPPGQRVERTLGVDPTGLPLGITEILAEFQASRWVLDLLRAEQVGTADLEAARRKYQTLVHPATPGDRPLTIGETFSTSAGPWEFTWDDNAPGLLVFELIEVLGLGPNRGSLFTHGVSRFPVGRPNRRA